MLSCASGRPPGGCAQDRIKVIQCSQNPGIAFWAHGNIHPGPAKVPFMYSRMPAVQALTKIVPKN